MYSKEIPFVITIIPMIVLSEEFWYPATMAEGNTPKLVANNFQVNSITGNFDINSTKEKDDHYSHRFDITEPEHKKRVAFSNMATKLENLSHIYGSIYSESENNVIQKDAGAILQEFYYSDDSRTRQDDNGFNFSDFASIQQKSKSIGSTTKNYFIRNRLGRVKPAEYRFLDVFQVVKFEHVLCSSTSGLDGRCLHDYDCQTIGGSPMGTCADGYGICCIIVFSCHGHSSEPVGWFTNPDYPLPNTDRLSCALRLNKTSQDVKQIRLDFSSFELLPPTGGTCENDQFIVSGHNINSVVPILCGINTGQHIYIEVGDTEGPIRLTIQTVAAESRLFSIKVSQLTRSDILAAPTGCLQYFIGPHGFIESFNYRNTTEITTAQRPSYMNNLNYAICIERETSSCSITYTNEDEMQIVNYETDGLPIIPPRQAGVEIFNCPSDWLLISAVRLCGERLNDGSVLQDFYLDAPVTDIGAGPITIWFRSDEGYVGRGFKLQYQQNLCAIST